MDGASFCGPSRVACPYLVALAKTSAPDNGQALRPAELGLFNNDITHRDTAALRCSCGLPATHHLRAASPDLAEPNRADGSPDCRVAGPSPTHSQPCCSCCGSARRWRTGRYGLPLLRANNSGCRITADAHSSQAFATGGAATCFKRGRNPLSPLVHG